MELFKVIKKPLITEKTQTLELHWVYTIEADPRATKIDIKTAFNRLYSVQVEKVNIIKVREKFKNTRTGLNIKRKPSIKALVTLKSWQRLDFSKLKIKD